ncbi:MAG: hypothetical protein U0Q16_16750 [Bryobacteraceae bacterium]
MNPWLTRLAFAAVAGPTLLAWILAVGEFCDWGRFRPWWRVEEFVRVDAFRDGVVNEVRSQGLPISVGDRIVSIAGKPYRKGLLERFYRESVPGEQVWVGIVPKSGKPPFEVQVTLADSYAALTPLVFMPSALILSVFAMRRRERLPLRIAPVGCLVAAVWTALINLTGLYANFSGTVRTALLHYGYTVEPAFAVSIGSFIWLACKPGWRRRTAAGVFLAVAAFRVAAILSNHGILQMKPVQHDAGALGLDRTWLQSWVYVTILVAALRTPPNELQRKATAIS